MVAFEKHAKNHLSTVRSITGEVLDTVVDNKFPSKVWRQAGIIVDRVPAQLEATKRGAAVIKRKIGTTFFGRDDDEE